ncbi:hypothetical protein HG530_003079 [Fusarium avenaceum]|nr:hypothetical protein HG530_003079 [Fusarium avenaceum]
METLNQSLSSEHTVLDLCNNILSVIVADKHNTTATSTHSSGTAKSVDEVDGCVWHIVENDVTDRKSIDTSRSQICDNQDSHVGERSSLGSNCWRGDSKRFGRCKGLKDLAMTLLGSISMEGFCNNALFFEIRRQFLGLLTLVDEHHNAANVNFTLDRAVMTSGLTADGVDGIGTGKILLVAVWFP